MIKYLEKDDFEKLIQKKVLVDFYANWCGPCKMLGSVLEKIENDIDIDIIKVDVDKFGDISKKYGVMSIPSIFIFDKGKEIKHSVGFMDENSVKNFIK